MRGVAEVIRIESDFPIAEVESRRWVLDHAIVSDQYWSGDPAPVERHFRVMLLWSATALYVKFVAAQIEPPVVVENPDLTLKSIGLWERDVCEIFVAPDKNDRNKYFEFEIAPTGEWLDLGIEVTATERLTDWDYKSNMESASGIETDAVISVLKIPFSSLGGAPKGGDVWLGNLFRCVGSGSTRGYLAWQPTRTAVPNFHVPYAFGEFHFVD